MGLNSYLYFLSLSLSFEFDEIYKNDLGVFDIFFSVENISKFFFCLLFLLSSFSGLYLSVNTEVLFSSIWLNEIFLCCKDG